MKHTRAAVAFTLIELIVVISVLVLLILIMVPSFVRVNDSAKRAICYQNLHHIGIACNSYTADYRTITVPAAYPEQSGGGNQPQPEMWASLLMYCRYIPKQSIDASTPRSTPFTKTLFYCPAAAVSLNSSVPFSGARFPNTAYNLFKTYADCWYGVNSMINSTVTVAMQLGSVNGPFRRTGDYRDPRKTVFAYDGYYMHANMHYIRNNVLVNGAERIQCRHLGATVDNLLLADGHAESVLDTLVPVDGADFDDVNLMRAQWDSFTWRLDQ